MSKIQSTLWFASKSLTLDLSYIKESDWSFGTKAEFLTKKYWLIAKQISSPFVLGKSHTKVGKRDIYYESRYGLAAYQGILTRHHHLLRIANIRNVHTVVDVGANVGMVSLLAHQLYPKATVYSLEPVPQVYKCLVKYVAGIDKIKTFKIAISDHTAEEKMSFDSQESAVSHLDSKGSVPVHVDTLDNFVQKQGIKSIDLLKIDTEGFEAHVLRGATNILAKTRYIYIEVTIQNNPNYTMSSLMKLLCSDTYDFQLIAFRNFGDSAEGEVPIMDCVLKNVTLEKLKHTK